MTARRTAAGPDSRPGGALGEARGAGPQLATLQRMQVTLDDSPRVAALQQVGSLLAERNPGQPALQRVAAGSGVIQLDASLFELTIPAHRSGYQKELRGRDAYDWIMTRHGQPAIRGIKDFASLVFRDGGMFVRAASRDFVVKLIADLHLGGNVAVGYAAPRPGGEDEDDGGSQPEVLDEGSEGRDEEFEDEAPGEDLGAEAEQVELRPFVLLEPQPGGPPLSGDALYETLRELHGDLLGDVFAEVEDGRLTVYAENIRALEQRLDEEGLADVQIWRSEDDIAGELPDLTVETMKAINAGGTIQYPYNAVETVEQLADLWPDQDASTGFADPEYFEKTGRFTWILRPSKSAAKAIESFVNLAQENPVIAECQTAAQAVEYYAILEAVGRRRFDARLGSEGVVTPPAQRLRLQFNLDPDNPLKQFYAPQRLDLDDEEAAGLGEDEEGVFSGPGHRPAKRGGRYFIQGPKEYTRRHPEGFLGGENAFYYGDEEGEQRFGGLGIENETELDIAAILADDFNRAPTATERLRARPNDPPGLHLDELPLEPEGVAQGGPTVYRATAQGVATVHGAGAMRARKEALNGAPVTGSKVNQGARWHVVDGELSMNRAGCGRVSFDTLVQTYADTFGLINLRVLKEAVRAENPGQFENPSRDQFASVVSTCRFPDPETLLRLGKGTGFQATSALVLDPGKIHRAFYA